MKDYSKDTDGFIKILIGFLIIVLVLLQYRLWFGDGRLQKSEKYSQTLENLQVQIAVKHQRNEVLKAEVYDLRKGQEAIEEIARYNLGFIKKDENFFQIIK